MIWSAAPNMSFNSEQEVRDLLSGLEIIKIEEKEFDQATALGDPKHWDVIEVIGRKPELSEELSS